MTWREQRVREMADLINGFPFDSADFADDGALPLVRIRDIVGASFETYVSAEVVPESALVRDGDVVIGMDGDFNVVHWSRGPAALNQRLCLLRPNGRADARYLAYALPAHLQVINDLTYATTVKHLSSGQVRGIRMYAPDLSEQRAIADYLDRETARIDTLIDEQERLIEVLRERRRTLLVEATSRGVSTSSRFRPTDVGWLGDVPTHWDVVALKWLTPVKRGASPRPIDDPIYFDDEGEWAWVRIADVTAAGSGGVLRSTTQTLSELGSSRSVKILPGALFVSIAATVGKPCITMIKCCIHDGFVYFPDLQVDPWWLFRIFEAGECYRGLGKLGTQLNLNTDSIGSIKVPVPPPDEIQQILVYIDEQTTKIDELIFEAEQFIELSRERRAALIAAAVTGRIDVRAGA